MVILVFIRHGESTDNLKGVWAGFKDAPLSNHGITQAQALGKTLSDTPLTAIHSSDLQRALKTAEVVRDSQQSTLNVIQSSLFREQNFGIAEGKPWKAKRLSSMSPEEHYTKGIFPAVHSRDGRFPEGESLDDVAERAERAIDEILLPYASTSGTVAVVSHGLFMKELLHALLKRNKDGVDVVSLEQIRFGHKNTAWTRVKVEITDGGISVEVMAINKHEHLLSLVRQKGGIGRLPYNANQDIRDFFGGQKLKDT